MKAVIQRAQQALAQKVFPGCVLGIVRAGDVVVLPFGCTTYGSDAYEVTIDSLYDCASITKSIPTATLALQLLDERKLTLDDLLITFVPEYRTRFREEVTIRHLLTYTLGNTTPLAGLADKTADAIFEAVCTEETLPPGTVFSYSNTPALLLGTVIGRILAQSLDQAADERILKPLGLAATTFAPHGAAPTEEGIQDIVHDESARVFARAGTTTGHAGLFSTVPDLLKFLEQVLAHPDERLTTNQIAHMNASTALGWELNQRHFMGKYRTKRTFGKTGFTGTSIVCDSDRQTAIVILSNRIYPKRPEDASAINAFRSDICDIIFSL